MKGYFPRLIVAADRAKDGQQRITSWWRRATAARGGTMAATHQRGENALWGSDLNGDGTVTPCFLEKIKP
jgi:hypothetical protein